MHVGGVGVAAVNFEAEEAQTYLKGMVQQWSGDEEGVAQVARRLSYFPLSLASDLSPWSPSITHAGGDSRAMDGRRPAPNLGAHGADGHLGCQQG